jgi:hypothetical protein
MSTGGKALRHFTSFVGHRGAVTFKDVSIARREMIELLRA